MNILLHQNWAGDSKLRPEVLDQLGIAPASDWDKRAMQGKYDRFTEAQLASWNEVYDPMIEDFIERYPIHDREGADELEVPAIYAGLPGLYRSSG